MFRWLCEDEYAPLTPEHHAYMQWLIPRVWSFLETHSGSIIVSDGGTDWWPVPGVHDDLGDEPDFYEVGSRYEWFEHASTESAPSSSKKKT